MVYHPKLGPTGSKFHNYWSGPYRVSKKLNAVTYEVEVKRPRGRVWNPALTIDRMRRYFSRSSWGELDEIIDDPNLWVEEEEDNLVVELEDTEDTSTSPVEDIESDLEMEPVVKPREPTRVQPDRTVKLRKLTSHRRYFNVDKQAFYLFPTPNSRNKKVYKLAASQVLTAKRLSEVRNLHKNPDSVAVQINSKEAQRIVDRVAHLTEKYHELNAKHYPIAFPYHTQPKIREAVKDMFQI